MSNLQTFLKQYTAKSYKKGEVILRQDTEPTCAYIIKKGIIKTYNITAKGEEKPIGFNLPHELFPMGWIFDHISKSQYFYETLKPCLIYAVPKDELIVFLRANPEAMFQLLAKTTRGTLIHQMRINALEQSKASEKILHTIHYLALCFGNDLRTDLVEIPLPITQQDIANLTGLTRETVSVELKNLAAQNIIFSRNRNYVVLTDRLDKLLDDTYDHWLIR